MGNGNSVHVQTDRPYFLVGDVVTGTVHLNVVKSFTAKGVYLKIKGQEKCGWSEYSSRNGKSRHKNRRATHSFFRCRVPVYERRGEVDAGQYAFPFRFTLPPDIPGSFNVREGDVYASVTYKIKAEVEVKGIFKSNVKATQEMQLFEPLRQHISRPLVEETRRIMFLCCFNRGELQTRVSMDRNAFIPGDQAAIFYEAQNRSKSDVRAIRCRLKRYLHLKAGAFNRFAGARSKNHGRTLTQHNYPGLPSQHTAWEQGGKHVPLPIQSSQGSKDLQPGVSGSIVRCEYVVEVESVMSLGKNSKAHIPITIYAPIPAAAQPAAIPPPNWRPQVANIVAIDSITKPEYNY